MSRTYHQETENLSEKEISRFLYCLYAYIALLVVFIAFFIADATAQDINTLKPDANISESDATEIQLIVNKIETPSMDVEVMPEPPLLDFNAPNYLELVYYRMITALVQRVDRENFYCQEDLNAGIKPCRFKSIKARDYYVNIFKAQWESEHPTTTGQALRAVKVVEPACPDGFEIYEGSGICNQFPTHVSAEQNYYHCSLNNFQLWLENADLKRQLEVRNIPDFRDGANKGNLWKPEADPKARCKGGTTILLDQKYSPSSIDILDANFNKIKSPSNFGKLDDGRPRFCAEGMNGASFGKGPLFIKVGDLTFRVNNPANRED